MKREICFVLFMATIALVLSACGTQSATSDGAASADADNQAVGQGETENEIPEKLPSEDRNDTTQHTPSPLMPTLTPFACSPDAVKMDPENSSKLSPSAQLFLMNPTLNQTADFSLLLRTTGEATQEQLERFESIDVIVHTVAGNIITVRANAAQIKDIACLEFVVLIDVSEELEFMEP